MTTNIKEQLEKDGYLIQEIHGISMYPLFIEGEDKVYIERVLNSLHVNAIILFTRFDNSNKYILHRIVDIKKEYYVVAGDNQRKSEIVFKEQVIGRVSAYYKKDKYITLEDEEYITYLNDLEMNLSKRKIYKPINNNSLILDGNKSLIDKLFPSKYILYQYIPLSRKYSILLPFAWIYRLFSKLIGR